MSYEQILYSVENRVATITLNRPDKLNAWTGQMEEELRAAFGVAEADEAVRAIVLTGAGRGFCAGADMNLLSGISGGQRPRDTASAPASTGEDANFTRKFSYFLHLKKPIFAAINGPIAGIAVCFSLFCDFRYMAEGTRLTTAFARRGLIAEHGISWMLSRLIGPMNAVDLLLSARPVEAAEAERMGLVRTLPAEGFLAAVQAKAAELAASSSPRSMAVMKRQVYDALFQNLAQAWDVADAEMMKSFPTEDFKEGVAHFLEKRAPNFTGR